MKKHLKHLLLLAVTSGLIAIQACKDQTGDVNLFSIQDDLNLGAQTAAQIEQDPTVKILDSATNTSAYKFLYDIRTAILNSGQIIYKNEFPWRVRIIRNDTTLNAFCTPGGYIYFYTGLLKFLDSTHHLAGVMGHEMAHADRRHSTDALTRQYGLSVLLDVVFGKDKGQLARIAVGLKELQYSRKAETEADAFSVDYLYPTNYDARGAAGFFEKLIAMGQGGGTPVFLSTHPSPDNRVQAIHAKWLTLGGKVGQTYPAEYKTFKNLLP
ncbi:MAG: M48 family metalloprotease [Bacteroidetes bacterium]|nr:M48 family metalloprotease [Bacteroidota bacterium]